MTDENAPAPPQAGDAPDPQVAPQIRVLGQYIKDFSFENPHAPASLMGGQEAPNIDLSIDVQAKRADEGNFEVVLFMEAKAVRGEAVAFMVELKYAGLFQLTAIPDNELEPVLLIECPRMLFPFARRIMAETTRDGGFPPLYVDPIDFAGLFRAQRTQDAPEAPAENGATPS